MSILDFWKKQTASTHEVPFFFFFGLWGVGWGGVVWGVEYWRICKLFLESLDKNLFVLACTWAVIYRWQQAVPLKMGLLRRILAFTNFVYSVVVLNYSCIGFLVSTSFAVLHRVLLNAIVLIFTQNCDYLSISLLLFWLLLLCFLNRLLSTDENGWSKLTIFHINNQDQWTEKYYLNWIYLQPCICYRSSIFMVI